MRQGHSSRSCELKAVSLPPVHCSSVVTYLITSNQSRGGRGGWSRRRSGRVEVAVGDALGDNLVAMADENRERPEASETASLVVEQESLSLLARHARISIGFRVDRVLEPSLRGGSGLEGIVLLEVPVAHPWHKDYDTLSGNGPTDWARKFDLTNWGLLGAYRDHQRVGGAVIAHRTPGVDLLQGRDDLAILWDLRVAPEARGSQVGAALFRAAEHWARERACCELTVETQNINAAACRFYARMGCRLGAINTRAYPTHPEEAQLLWYRSL